MWDPQHLTTLQAPMASYSDSFLLLININDLGLIIFLIDT
jgi:hypothetical protein